MRPKLPTRNKRCCEQPEARPYRARCGCVAAAPGPADPATTRRTTSAPQRTLTRAGTGSTGGGTSRKQRGAAAGTRALHSFRAVFGGFPTVFARFSGTYGCVAHCFGCFHRPQRLDGGFEAQGGVQGRDGGDGRQGRPAHGREARNRCRQAQRRVHCVLKPVNRKKHSKKARKRLKAETGKERRRKTCRAEVGRWIGRVSAPSADKWPVACLIQVSAMRRHSVINRDSGGSGAGKQATEGSVAAALCCVDSGVRSAAECSAWV